MNLGMLRRLVRRTDAREVLQLAAAGLLVQALRIALLGFFERRIDEHFEELARLHQVARQTALRTERRDERHEHDQARVHHELGHFGDATDVLDAVRIRESQILVQAMTHVIAIERVRVSTERMQAFFDQVRDRRLTRARQAGEPQDASPLSLQRRARMFVHIERLPMNVLGTTQSEAEQARADRVIGDLVDQDEAAGLAIVRVGIERDRAIETQIADADLVELQLLRGQMLHRVDVHLVLRRRDAAGDGARAELDQIRTAGKHRFLVHPDDGRLELIGNRRRRGGRGNARRHG